MHCSECKKSDLTLLNETLEKYKNIKGITLIASPILKPKRGIKYYFMVYLYKLRKMLNKRVYNMGSEDYKNTSKQMKHFFINIVNTHYNKQIKNIDIPVLLIYSKNDDKVELKKGKKLNEKLKKSSLKVINGDHFAYLGNSSIVSIMIRDFFKENDKKREYYL